MVRPATLLKKRPWHRCFPVNFAEFLRTPFHRTPPDDCFLEEKATNIYGAVMEGMTSSFGDGNFFQLNCEMVLRRFLQLI